MNHKHLAGICDSDPHANAGFLIADASQPLITGDELWEELILYRISGAQEAELYELFERISGKSITAKDRPDELSGGQKVILMLCLALCSPASKIVFCDLRHSLDVARYEMVLELISHSGKQVEFRDS